MSRWMLISMLPDLANKNNLPFFDLGRLIIIQDVKFLQKWNGLGSRYSTTELRPHDYSDGDTWLHSRSSVVPQRYVLYHKNSAKSRAGDNCRAGRRKGRHAAIGSGRRWRRRRFFRLQPRFENGRRRLARWADPAMERCARLLPIMRNPGKGLPGD